MVFSRFREAIKDQNWFTVFLEIAIVVLGIFLGLRIDEWNQDRLLRQQEAVYLGVVAQDLQGMREELVASIDDRSGRIDQMVIALRALEACDDSESSRKAVRIALEQYQVSPPFNYVNATYDEMVANGALARIRDQDLKYAISSTFASLADLGAAIRSVRVSMPVVDAIIWQEVPYTLMEDRPRARAIVDIPAICESVPIRNAFIEMIDIQADSAGFMHGTLEQVDALLARLPRSGQE